MLYVITIIGLTIGNFVYQLIRPSLFKKPSDWKEAAKLSFFQAAAILTLLFNVWICHRNL